MESKNTGWGWVNSEEGRFLQFKPLRKEGFNHGFFTSEWYGKGPVELVQEFAPGFNTYQTNQIHGDKVVEIEETSPNQIEKADGLVNRHKRKSLWIYTADCIPVIFADTNHGNIAIVHCGWKGIKNLILFNTVKKLESLGTKKENLFILLGPAISGSNYQVDSELAEEIFPSVFRDYAISNQHSKDHKLSMLFNAGLINYDKSPGKVLLDIRIAAKHQLSSLLQNNKKIHISPLCTYANKDLFHSWRRDKKKLCQWSGISSP